MAPRAKRNQSRKNNRYKSYRSKSVGKSLSAWKTTSVSRILPKIKALEFNYADEQQNTVAAGTNITFDYRANSLNKPSLAIGALRKPRFVNTFLGDNNTNAPYRRYSVLGCDAIATVINQSGSHMYAALSMYSNQASGPSTVNEARTRSDTILRVLPPSGSGSATTKIHMKRSIAQILGVKDMLDNPDMKSDFNTNPAALVVCRLTIFNPFSVSTEMFAYDIAIKYDSRLFVRNDVADS